MGPCHQPGKVPSKKDNQDVSKVWMNSGKSVYRQHPLVGELIRISAEVIELTVHSLTGVLPVRRDAPHVVLYRAVHSGPVQAEVEQQPSIIESMGHGR